MINLTDNAVKAVKALQEEKAAPGQCLRILIETGGCSGFEYGMSFDERKPDDLEFSDNGVDFLVDPTSHEHLNGSVVDFDDGLAGKGFEVRNPNANSTCGCGRSFN